MVQLNGMYYIHYRHVSNSTPCSEATTDTGHASSANSRLPGLSLVQRRDHPADIYVMPQPALPVRHALHQCHWSDTAAAADQMHSSGSSEFEKNQNI